MKDPQQELEHLRKLASADLTMRFGKLLKIVRQEVFLAMSWERMRTNKGSRTPGIDGQTKEDIDAKTFSDLAQELAERRYQPQPVRRVYIPKGKNQRRGLGIPSIRDRIVQAAVAQFGAPLVARRRVCGESDRGQRDHLPRASRVFQGGPFCSILYVP